ncbi:FHA domain-containing protein [Agromyces sp. C10]|uniref:FHA domain-containing protein n=1 Tax=Agromyces sp. C10 TaxID=2935077 RepID=UPI00200AC6C7|nr:FHA domain-containing protein [Agromyces sp. C10]MCK8608792.1 FHA domain-containing protein [Agromyces sp. C10]
MVEGAVRSRIDPEAPQWDVVVGARFIVALAAPAPDRVTSAMADLAGDESVEVEDLVARIPMGPAGIEDLALVWWPRGGDPLTALVRGRAVVDLASPGGARRLDARGITPWHLAEFSAVTRLRIAAAGSPLEAVRHAAVAGEGVPSQRAAFRAAAIEWAWRELPERADPYALDADTVLARRPPADAAPDPDTVRSLRHAPPTAPMPIVEDADTIRSPARSGSTSTVRVPRPELVIEDDTVAARDDDAGDTLELPIPATAYRVVGGPAGVIDAPVIIGRSPSPPRMPQGDVVLVRVESPAEVVSATHLELRREGGRVVATDLRSTNGTIVNSAAGVRRLRPGESVVVAAGTTLQLGGDTIVEILTDLGGIDA